jgi:hypothetical protein
MFASFSDDRVSSTIDPWPIRVWAFNPWITLTISFIGGRK